MVAGAESTRVSGKISSRTAAGAAGSSLAPSLIQSCRNSKLFEIAGQPQAALVGDLPQGLPQDETGLRRHRVDSPAGDFVREDRKVLVGKVAAQAQPEAPLARRRAVASARVAARLAECRNHVPAKAHRAPAAPIPRTLTVVLASRLPVRATIVAVPSPLGITRPLGVTVATAGFELTHSTDAVWSFTDAARAAERRDELGRGAAVGQLDPCGRIESSPLPLALGPCLISPALGVRGRHVACIPGPPPSRPSRSLTG